jgi:hypothetical protein
MRDTPFTGPVLAEVRTENLDAAEGSAANGSRLGLLARYIADTVGTAATSLAAIIVKLAKPAANAETDATIAEAVGIKADTAQTTVATTRSIMAYVKGCLNQLSTVITSTGTTIPNLHAVPAKDATTDTNMRDAIGKKDDTAVVEVGTTKSIMAYVKGAISLLVNGTYGLSALQTLLSAIPTTAMRGTDNAFLASVGGAKDDAAAEGAVTDEDTAMAYIKQLVTAIQLIPTTAMRGTDSAFLAAVGGALDDAAAEGAVTNTDTAMAYIKQLVTAIQLIPTTAMRGTDSAALASVLGALNNAAAEGAVTDTDTAMAYLKQLVTAIQLIPTTAMRGTDDAALAATALTNATWTDAKAAFLDAKISDIPTTAQRGTDNAFLASVGGALDTAATYAVAADKTAMAYIKGLVDAGIAVAGAISDVAPSTDDFDTNLTEATNDHYIHQLMLMTSGVLKGQTHYIEGYTGASKNCNFAAITSSGWTDAPANGDTFIILPDRGGLVVYGFILIANAVAALNNISAANVNTEVDNALNTAIPGSPTADSVNERIASMDDHILCSMDFWSAPVEEVSVDGDAGTLAAIATTVVAEVPGTFVRVIGMFKFRAVENTYAGVNKLDGATVAATSQVIQIDDAATTGYVDCITFVDDMFTLAASTREGGDVIIGSTDVAARVDGNDTYTWRWLLSKADQDDINFNDAQFGLRVWYSI